VRVHALFCAQTITKRPLFTSFGFDAKSKCCFYVGNDETFTSWYENVNVRATNCLRQVSKRSGSNIFLSRFFSLLIRLKIDFVLTLCEKNSQDNHLIFIFDHLRCWKQQVKSLIQSLRYFSS
jgi:hypothetical protein